ncbi:MAG: DUF996 domain-containing protein [Candidatus Bathyarchaeia archaeon]
MTIESNRTMGGIAACFILIGVVSQVSELFQYALPNSSVAYLALSGISGIVGVLGLVGLLLFFIAMYGFSRDYGDHRIFDNLLYGLIIVIIVGVIAGIFTIILILSNIGSIIPNFTSAPASPSQITSSMLSSILPVLPVFAVIGLIWVLFNVRAFNLLADKSKVLLFRTGAIVLLAGALVSVLLTIIFAVIGSSVSLSFNSLLTFMIPGGLVQDVAWVLLAMAYFRIKPPASPAIAPVNVQPVLSVSAQVKYCSHCGAPNQTDAIYCTRCGQKL